MNIIASFPILFLLAIQVSSSNKSQNISCNNVTPSPKKGVGLAESKGFGDAQLQSLNVSWYYNWGLTSNITTDKEFIPMIFSLKKINQIKKTSIILGFNEPDKIKQSNISVSDALNNWNTISLNASKVGSPAMAGNPVKENSWLFIFMKNKPKVDFITIHWYKGCDATKFITDIKKIIATYNLPVWITEFAPQTVSESKENPTKYSQTQVANFISQTIEWMEQEPMIERYAWHDSKFGTSALFTEEGVITQTGMFFRDAK